MPVPPKERFFEDFRPGEVLEFGDYLVTEEEIVEFAKRYDPQPFHIDPAAAKGCSRAISSTTTLTFSGNAAS